MTQRNNQGLIRCDWFDCQETSNLISICALTSFCQKHYDIMGFKRSGLRTIDPRGYNKRD